MFSSENHVHAWLVLFSRITLGYSDTSCNAKIPWTFSVLASCGTGQQTVGWPTPVIFLFYSTSAGLCHEGYAAQTILPVPCLSKATVDKLDNESNSLGGLHGQDDAAMSLLLSKLCTHAFLMEQDCQSLVTCICVCRLS